MPSLNWLTRSEDIQAASGVPFRALTEVPELSYGGGSTDNILIHGDNLEALRALLPFYAGQVKCIYIDPPYNTGSAFEHYDDNLEHATWLKMMYPRLVLLRELLAENGSMWISIDDDEGHYLKVLCDEIFGRRNFVANVVWQKKHTRSNDATWFSDNHDHILCYAKDKISWRPNLLARTENSLGNYSNPDNDPRGVWASGPCHAKTPSEKTMYPITTPTGRKVYPPPGTSWRFSKDNFEALIADKRIYFGKTGNNIPRYKRFITDVQEGFVPLTIWLRDEAGDNQEGKTEIKKLFDDTPFTTPKPERLIERILTLGSENGDLVLDSFLGSGTTAAVALKMGRRFIGVELGEQAKTHCAVRLRKVIDGEQGGISKSVNWQGGGGFRFYELGAMMFDEFGRIQESITFGCLAAHIWFSETKTPYQPFRPNCLRSAVLGIHKGNAYSLLFNGILHDRSVNGGNVLNRTTLQLLRDDLAGADYKKLIVYGEWSKLLPKTMKRENIEFRQIPYKVKK
jgi:adenine-specific DNA-methyltransferase